MKRRVIYTAIVGAYDAPPAIPPQAVDRECDYLCFSDEAMDLPQPWQLRKISPLSEGSAATNRWVKFCVHQLLPEHEEALYMDGNLDLLRRPISAFEKLREDQGCVFISHPQRRNVQDEIIACMLAGKVSLKESMNLVAAQSRNGFKDRLPLTANRMFARRLADAHVNRMFEAVFLDYLHGPARDQLHLQHALERFGVSHAILPRQWALETFSIRPHRHSDPGRGREVRWLLRMLLAWPLRMVLYCVARINRPRDKRRD